MRLTETQLATAIAAAKHAAVAPPPEVPTVRRMRVEDGMQRALCQFWSLAYPESWDKTFHVPNGLAARNRKLGAIFVGLGMKAGVPDFLCVEARGPYSGLALELKQLTGRVSTAQDAWAHRFRVERWAFTTAYTIDAAIEVVRTYHALPRAVR